MYFFLIFTFKDLCYIFFILIILVFYYLSFHRSLRLNNFFTLLYKVIFWLVSLDIINSFFVDPTINLILSVFDLVLGIICHG